MGYINVLFTHFTYLLKEQNRHAVVVRRAVKKPERLGPVSGDRGGRVSATEGLAEGDEVMRLFSVLLVVELQDEQFADGEQNKPPQIRVHCLSSAHDVFVHDDKDSVHTTRSVSFICLVAIAYGMGQTIKLVCLCPCVRLRALSRSHFLRDFYQNWNRRKNPKNYLVLDLSINWQTSH